MQIIKTVKKKSVYMKIKDFVIEFFFFFLLTTLYLSPKWGFFVSNIVKKWVRVFVSYAPDAATWYHHHVSSS